MATESSALVPTSNSPSSPNNTFFMPASPVRSRKTSNHPYRPQIITTVGARPACLVNASVTYVGEDQIYAFGGFDQYTDEVYNHVLRLNLQTKQWNLVDNYGDIPGVRMGHTANLWQGNKLLVYGGENEHRSYLSDVIIFDLQTAHWTQPELHGIPPRGRARHSAVIHEEKLYIVGGMTGSDNYVLDDICYLDLKTWTWSRVWKFVPRYDHTTWVWAGRIWVYGGMGEELDKTNELWWLDLRGSPALATGRFDPNERRLISWRNGSASHSPTSALTTPTNVYGTLANSSSVQTNSASVPRLSSMAPGAISSVKFVSSPDLPQQTPGLLHFHVFTSGYLLVFVTPADVRSPFDTSLCALDLDSLKWQRLADGKDLFNPNYRWHYLTINQDGTQSWLLGCPPESTNNGNGTSEELLSDVLHIDLQKLGIVGNKLASESKRLTAPGPTSDATPSSPLSAIGADLASMFDQPPESGSGTDFVVTGEIYDEASMELTTSNASDAGPRTKGIHVHRLILQARWPHFRRLYASQMLEFHTKKLALPEPYSTVRAFLFYLYSDSIVSHPENGPSLSDVAGMLVMANMYDMPRLRLLCVDRLSKELDVAHAAIIWERATVANEDYLRRRAARFCMTHWGRVVRTDGFKSLPRQSLVDLCEEIDEEGRVVGGAELEVVGGLGGARFGSNYEGSSVGAKRKKHSNSSNGPADDDDGDEEEDATMDVS